MRHPARSLSLSLLACALTSCALLPRRSPPPAPTAALRLDAAEAPRFEDMLPKQSLIEAARRSLAYLEGPDAPKGPFKLGDSSYTTAALADGVRRFIEIVEETQDGASLDERLRAEFDVYRSSGTTPEGSVVFSAYYEPVFPASDKPDPAFPFALYARPDDLLEINLGDFNPKYAGERLAARLKDGRLGPYFNREDIDSDGALKGRGLELAWLGDAFDRLDLHIEGSGLLKFPDGRVKRAQFAATSGHPYRSVGRILIDSGAIAPGAATHEGIREYLRSHPDAARWVIARNPRYTFFRLEDPTASSGPQGTIKQPLVAGRSIALDDKLFPLGAVCYVTLPIPVADASNKYLGSAPTSRFVLAQDTGGAIKGPGRVDLYVGTGVEAKAVATRLWDEGRLYFLMRKLPPPRR